MPETKSLVRKLAEISKEIGRVPKNGYNAFHKYKYVLESDLVDHIRPLLADRNVIIVPRVARTFGGESATVGRVEEMTGWAHNNDGDLSIIIFEYDIIDGDSNERITTSAVGYGSDKGDKGAYKASTGAYKYMLMRLFQVATGDDPEGDERVDQRVQQRQEPTQMPSIGASSVTGMQVGGRTTGATTLQVREAKLRSRELKLGAQGLRDLIEKTLGDALTLPEEESGQAQVLNHYLEDLSAEDIGKLITVMNAALAEPTTGITMEEAASLKFGEQRGDDDSDST